MKKMESKCEMGDERDEDAEQYVRFGFGCVWVKGENTTTNCPSTSAPLHALRRNACIEGPLHAL